MKLEETEKPEETEKQEEKEHHGVRKVYSDYSNFCLFFILGSNTPK